MTVEYPGAGIVQLGPDDNVAISRNLDHVFREALLGLNVCQLALFIKVLDEGSVYWMTEDVTPHHPVPAPVLMNGMSNRPVVADQDDLHPFVFTVRELQHVGTLAVGLAFIAIKVALKFSVSNRKLVN